MTDTNFEILMCDRRLALLIELWNVICKKKVSDFPVNDIPAGDGEFANLF